MSWFKPKKKSVDEQLFEAALYGDEDWITSHWADIRLNDVDFVDTKNQRMFHLKDFTPLIAAASSGHARLVKFFIEVGGDMNRATENGWTALIFAVQNQKIEVIELLLSQPGLQINHVDTMGRTALHWAAQDKKLDVLKLLLDHPDTDVTIRNRTEKTAEDCVGSMEGLKLFCLHRGVDPGLLDNPESANSQPAPSALLNLANITSMKDHAALQERVTTQEQHVQQLTTLLEQSENILQEDVSATEQRFAELSAAIASKRNGGGALYRI